MTDILKKNTSNNTGFNVGLVGSTGLVGGAFLTVLADRKFPVKNLRPFASKASLGKTIFFNGQSYPVEILSETAFDDLDLVFIATGEDISLEWSPKIANKGVFVIDNSSAFRLHPETPLVCPEINSHLVNKKQKLYANPNCSTIQLVVLLGALKNAGTLKDVTVASYQAVSGGGRDALSELKNQSTNTSIKPLVFPKQIAFNCIPQIGGFDEFGFSSEEQKIMRETKKILELPNLNISAQCVRVPVENGHAESAWVTFEETLTKEQVLKALNEQEGLNVRLEGFDTQVEVSGSDETFVSRIRQDLDNPKRWLFWIVADNIRKGAATNAIQIAEKITDL